MAAGSSTMFPRDITIRYEPWLQRLELRPPDQAARLRA